MKNRNRRLRRAAAFILAAVLAGSSVELPAAATGGDTGTGNTGMGTAVVTTFSGLDEEIRTQTLDTGAEESSIHLPTELTVTLEIQPAESGVEAAAAVKEPDTQTEPVTQEPVPDHMQTEENTGTWENPDVTQEQTEEPETDQGTEEKTEPVTPSAMENTEQTETPAAEEPEMQPAEAQVTEPVIQQQEEPAEPSGQEGQATEAEAPAAETGAAETAAVLQAEPPAEPEVPAAEGQKARKTADTEAAVTETSPDGGILTSLLDAVFPSVTVHAAESTNVQTVENFTLTGVTWKLDAEKSSAAEFSSDETAAGNTYTYVPVLPETVTVENVEYTLTCGENAGLPEITVTIAENTGDYGTIIAKGTTGDCTWALYDTDDDGTEDLLVIGGTGAMPDYYGVDTPWYGYRENIKKLVVEKGVTTLGYLAFANCTSLEEAILPSTLEKIETYAFNSCKSLGALVIPSGVTEIGEQSFGNCSSLKYITLPDTLKSIGQNAFYQCGLIEIEIPEGVETIGDRTFMQCYSLQSVILPSALKSIGEGAFYNDSNLTIIVPESVQTIGSSAFSRAKAVYNLSDCTITGSGISTKVNHDKITLVENGKSSEQRVLPANCVAGSRYAGTRYDASYYYSSNEGITAWYVQNEDTYEKVTSETSFQNTPTFYYAKAFDDTTVEVNAAGESGDSYTLEVKDKETGETLKEGKHYTQEMTDSTDWEETDAGSLTKTVTVTVTGIAGGGYVGTMGTTVRFSAEAVASVSRDGGRTADYYVSIEEAWAAAKEASNGDTQTTLTLLQDITTGTTLTVESGDDIIFASAAGTNYTLNGDANETDGGLIHVAGGAFTLESGTIRNGENGSNAIAVSGGGSFVMNGGTVIALADGHSGICVYEGGTATINGGSASGYNGLAIVNGGSGTVYGGTFTGTFDVSKGSAAVLLRNVGSTTLKSILKSGRAYYSGTDVIAENLITDLTGRSLTGTVTVDECKHSYNTWTDKGDGENHSGTCVVCGHEETEAHDWETDGSCKAEGCTAQAAASVTVNGGEPVYYTAIEAAWQAAKGHPEGATVTLLSDVTVSSTLMVENGDDITLTCETANDNYTISVSSGADLETPLSITGGSFTLQRGSLKGSDTGKGCIVRDGYFTMLDGTISGRRGLDVNGGHIRISGGTISGDTSFFGSGLRVLDTAADVSLSGGSFSGNTSVNMWAGGTIGSILAPGYAYKGTDWGVYEYWLSEAAASQSNSTTLVTVQKAPIQSVNISPDVTTTITYGDTAPTLTATATQPDGSTNDVAYQWYLDGVKIDGATGETYTPDKLDVGEYNYTCKTTADKYSITSTVTTVKVEQRELELVIIGETTKTYDETTDAPAGLSIEIRNLVSGDDVTVAAESYTYNSANVKEAKTITANGVTLSGADADNYKLPEESITISGTITKSQPTITFHGSLLGQYNGQAFSYTGIKNAMTIRGASYEDVVFSWTDSEQKPLRAEPTDAGTYTLIATIPATDNRELATASTPVTIDPKPVSRPTITLNPDRYEYDGTAKEPDVKVFDGDTEIDSDEYTVTYSNNVEVGTAIVTITNRDGGNYEINESAATFEITKPDLATATVTLEQDRYTYDGTEHKPMVTVVKNGRTLEKDTDYTVTYENNVDVGTASVTITAVENGSYEGSQTVTFKIRPVEEVISVEVSWDALEYTYTDGAWNPDAHAYEEGEWTADNGGNSITVTNTGNVDTTVSYLYSRSVEPVSGSFADGDGNPIDSSVALPEGEEKKAYLTLTGRPSSDFTAGTLGTVTVTIGQYEVTPHL